MWWESVHGSLFVTESWHLGASTILFVICILALFPSLKIFSRPAVPRIFFRQIDNNKIAKMLGSISFLKQCYEPPWLWGKSGHLQTAIYGAISLPMLQRKFSERVLLPLSDGSTTSFDIFEPIKPHQSCLDITLVMVPGISNCSESNYIKTCIHYALDFGFRCVSLNHIGVISSIEVTGTRIFNYGITDEISAMMNHLFEKYPSSYFISIGYSMGANLTALFLLRTSPEQRKKIIFAISICQGYSATISAPMYHEWKQGRRFYNHMIVENVKRILRRNYDAVVKPHVTRKLIDDEKLWSSCSIASLDEHYNRRVAGFDNLDSFYEWCSCLPRLSQIDIPVVFLNAEDDPVVPKDLYKPIREMCEAQENMAFISTKHGGHLGFLEGSSYTPNPTTWLDKFVVEIANHVILTYLPKEKN